MIISGNRLGKKFDRNWIFKDLSFEINSGDRLAIIGPNGSGKSTLLQIITGALGPSTGSISYSKENQIVESDLVSSSINYCAPYIELLEEYSIKELLEFHSHFQNPVISLESIIQRMGYSDMVTKPIGQYSSGMKQRVRLALAFFFKADVIALDEPTTNLDESGIKWFLDEIKSLNNSVTVLISSNQRYEYDFCERTIELSLDK